VTGTGDRDDVESPSTAPADESGETDSVDSFLRDVARAGLTPRGSTLESPNQGTPSFRTLVPGQIVAGRFRLERKLGEGGMGVVWQAVHAVTRKPVALKVLKRSGEDDVRAVQRFLREARAACAVRHPSVVEVHDVLELDDGSPVMVMELLAGETLAQRLSREHVLTLSDLARVMVHVCSAVGCAHALGIVHRDLKPENIFLVKSPSGQPVKVLDFGIAKLTASDGDAARTGAITGTGAILGTPYYMAPEQLFGEKDIDHRADIWALGIILYEALTGERPTQGENVGQIYKTVVTDAIVPLGERAPHLPAPIVELVGSMLSRDRAKRPADISAILSILANYTTESFPVVTASPPPDAIGPDALPPPLGPETGDGPATSEQQVNRSGVSLPLPSTPGSSRGPIWALVSLAAAAALGIGGFVTWRGRAAPPPPPVLATAGLGAIAPIVAPAASPLPVPASPPEVAPVVPLPAAAGPNRDLGTPGTAPTKHQGPLAHPSGTSSKLDASATAAPAAPVGPARSTSATAPVDPGSYQ
jgi:serine/threonine protein kinase